MGGRKVVEAKLERVALIWEAEDLKTVQAAEEYFLLVAVVWYSLAVVEGA